MLPLFVSLKSTLALPHAERVGLTPMIACSCTPARPPKAASDVRTLTLHAMWRMGKTADSAQADEGSGVVTAQPMICRIENDVLLVRPS